MDGPGPVSLPVWVVTEARPRVPGGVWFSQTEQDAQRWEPGRQVDRERDEAPWGYSHWEVLPPGSPGVRVTSQPQAEAQGRRLSLRTAGRRWTLVQEGEASAGESRREPAYCPPLCTSVDQTPPACTSCSSMEPFEIHRSLPVTSLPTADTDALTGQIT